MPAEDFVSCQCWRIDSSEHRKSKLTTFAAAIRDSLIQSFSFEAKRLLLRMCMSSHIALNALTSPINAATEI